ncbi:MAG: hypothetical protein JRI54_04025 [Deltaproteobacteria bacterium]|nr:hypothetical protein [Deltaproteobacteria bacterium]
MGLERIEEYEDKSQTLGYSPGVEKDPEKTYTVGEETKPEEPTSGSIHCRAIPTDASLREQSLYVIEKSFWIITQGYQQLYSRFYDAPEEDTFFQRNSIATMDCETELQQHEKEEPITFRGIFNPPYKRKILFSKRIKIKTADLPRWKPKITIDRRSLEINND